MLRPLLSPRVFSFAMKSRQSTLWLSASILLLAFSGISSSIPNCPAGCRCPTETSVVCQGISVFPNLTTAPNNFSDFEFSDCQFVGNVLPQVPQAYASATSLSLRNCITVIDDDAFHFLENLTSLTITGHRQLNFSSSAPFHDLRILRHLDLSDNGLSTLPLHLCSGTPFLRFINASHNHLDAILTDTFQDCSRSLEEVYLMNNSITTLTYECLPWFYLSYADVSENPWKCDCQLQWVQDLPESHFSGARCESPDDLKGKDVNKVVSVMSCGFGRSSVALGLGIPILILCIIMISYYIYRIAKSHHYKKRLRSSVKYSSVYEDTVESSSKRSILA